MLRDAGMEGRAAARGMGWSGLVRRDGRYLYDDPIEPGLVENLPGCEVVNEALHFHV